MKVYRSLTEWRMNLGFVTCKIGELLFECSEKYSYDYEAIESPYGRFHREDVEDHPESFEYVETRDGDFDYYTKRLYTQEYVDNLLKTKQP